VPIETLRFEHVVLTKVQKRRDKPSVGAHIYGLYLEGATWNSKDRTLAEPQPKQLFSEMNVVWLKPTQSQPVAARDEGAFDCPVYKTLARSEHVFFLRLPSVEVGEEHWIKRSAALVCSLDD
jgi:dynein heavy chain